MECFLFERIIIAWFCWKKEHFERIGRAAEKEVRMIERGIDLEKVKEETKLHTVKTGQLMLI